MSTDGNTSGADPSADESRDQRPIDNMTIVKTFYADQILAKTIRQDNAENHEHVLEPVIDTCDLDVRPDVDAGLAFSDCGRRRGHHEAFLKTAGTRSR